MMNYQMNTEVSPIASLDTSFLHYLARRKREASEHMKGSVPDYAFALDYELRSKMDQIPGFYKICKSISSTSVTRAMQMYNQNSMQVGPKQFPEIYEMGLDCAHRLGIGVPNIYITNSPLMNAFAYAADNTSPFLVLYTGIVDRMTPGELKAVIAHECGHIHNQHVVYKNAISRLLSRASGLLGSLVLSAANIALMQFWTRALEVTADRAAVICADNFKDVLGMQAKLASGGVLNNNYQQVMDIDTIMEQLEMTFNNPTRFLEIMTDHPSFARRIACAREFVSCDVFFSWRPEMKKPGVRVRSKIETDSRCKKFVNVVKNK